MSLQNRPSVKIEILKPLNTKAFFEEFLTISSNRYLPTCWRRSPLKWASTLRFSGKEAHFCERTKPNHRGGGTMKEKAFPRYYNQAQANLAEALIPSFGAGEAVGRLMVAAARGQRAAREIMALREKWAEEQGEAPDHQTVNVLDYQGISGLAQNPILTDRDLEALGMLLVRISELQAGNGLAWEFNRIQTGEWLERLAFKLNLVSAAEAEPEKIKALIEDLAAEIERIGKILSQATPWEEPAREAAWEVRKRAEERVNDLMEEILENEEVSRRKL